MQKEVHLTTLIILRYATKHGKIYATIMAWPNSGKYILKAFSPLSYHNRRKFTPGI